MARHEKSVRSFCKKLGGIWSLGWNPKPCTKAPKASQSAQEIRYLRIATLNTDLLTGKL